VAIRHVNIIAAHQYPYQYSSDVAIPTISISILSRRGNSNINTIAAHQYPYQYFSDVAIPTISISILSRRGNNNINIIAAQQYMAITISI